MAPRPEDEEVWEHHAEERAPAEHRIDTAAEAPELIISGDGLASATGVRAEGQEGQGTMELVIVEATMERLRARFLPTSVVAGGLFLLTVTTSVGSAEAQVYFLQGRDGQGLDCDDSECRMDRDLVVEGSASVSGDLEVAGAGTFDSLEVNDLMVLRSVWLPECPSGYERDDTRDDIVLCANGRDEMVKVGDFWVDRYEASVWENADCSGTQYGGDSANWGDASGFPYHGSFTEPLYACSVTGVTPSRWITWFQAQSACAASGKRLITNAEWQAAVAGTNDPGESGASTGRCLTDAEGPRRTGRAGVNPGGSDSCISYWGAEDMISNLAEWVEDWYGQGPDTGAEGGQPDEYFNDGYWNVDPAEWRDDLHFPAAGLRGGYWRRGVRSGAFALSLSNAPSHSNGGHGFRCAVH